MVAVGCWVQRGTTLYYYFNVYSFVILNCQKGNAFMKYSLHGKKAASVLLKLFISGMKDAP